MTGGRAPDDRDDAHGEPKGAGDASSSPSEATLENRLRATMKTQLRASMLALRRALPSEPRAARSAGLVAQAAALDVVRAARTIASYVPVRGEADPSALVAAAWDRGARVALPHVDLRTGTLAWREHVRDRPLVVGAYGISEPPDEAPTIDASSIDLVLVPAVALDELGHRIGMGKGFYDRALTELTRAIRVGVVFDFQLVAEVPAEPHDLPVDWVVTDARTIDARAARTARAVLGP